MGVEGTYLLQTHLKQRGQLFCQFIYFYFFFNLPKLAKSQGKQIPLREKDATQESSNLSF